MSLLIALFEVLSAYSEELVFERSMDRKSRSAGHSAIHPPTDLPIVASDRRPSCVRFGSGPAPAWLPLPGSAPWPWRSASRAFHRGSASHWCPAHSSPLTAAIALPRGLCRSLSLVSASQNLEVSSVSLPWQSLRCADFSRPTQPVLRRNAGQVSPVFLLFSRRAASCSAFSPRESGHHVPCDPERLGSCGRSGRSSCHDGGVLCARGFYSSAAPAGCSVPVWWPESVGTGHTTLGAPHGRLT